MPIKITPLRVIIALILIIVGIPIAGIAYYSISQVYEANRLKDSINSIKFNSSYREVHIDCHDVELRQECFKAYYVSGDEKTIETSTISDLKQQGYDFVKIPGGYDGPSPAYHAQQEGKVIIIKFVESDNQAYKEKSGNVQLVVYFGSGI